MQITRAYLILSLSIIKYGIQCLRNYYQKTGVRHTCIIRTSMGVESMIIFSNMKHDCIVLLELVPTTTSTAINIFIAEVKVSFNIVDIDWIIF